MSIIKHQDRTLGGGGGHKVLNSQGTEMTDRPNLQFLGMQVTDDNANGKTVVQGPSVPTALSAFTNDTNFIDNTVSNLTNYYAKTESYTKTEVDTLISAAKMGRFILVSVLPTEDIDTSAIYLLPKSLTSSSNIKDEYINLDGTSTGWEKIGDTEIDLSNYATISYVDQQIGNVLTEEF